MRKVLAFMLSVVLVFSLATQAFAATVSLETEVQTIAAGEQVTVKLTQSEAVDGITAIKYHVYYDNTLFELTASEPGKNITFGKTGTDTKGFYQVINYLDTTSEGVTIEAGTIATMTFTALQTVTESQSAAFQLVNKGVMGVGDVMLENANLVEDGTVTLTVTPAAKTYTVTLTEGEGYTVTAAEGSESPVTEGGSFSFTVTVDTENFEGTPIVKANGVTLPASDGVYTINNITENQTVTVEGIQEQGVVADKVIYQNGSNGAQWPSGTPGYVNTVTLKGLSVIDVQWDESYENCTVTLHKKTAADASYSLATMVAVNGQQQMISMFSADIDGSAYDGNSFTHSGSLENGQAEIVYTAKFGNYSGTKTIHLVVDGAAQPEPETYEVTLTQGEGYTITAAEGSESPVTEGGSFSFTVTVNDGYEGTPVVKAGDTVLEAENGVYTIENITADQIVTVSGITAKAPGYAVEVPASATTVKDGEVTVNVTISHSDAAIDYYNAYDVTISYDAEDLTYVSGTAAHSGAKINHNETAGTIQIVGYGETKDISTAMATLKFTAKASGKHNVTIAEAKVDNSGNAIAADTPDAAIPTPTTEVKVAYPVTLPENFTGERTVLPDGEYRFSAPNEYYDITITVGGEKVNPVVDGLNYTVPAVNGDVVITAVGKTYNVTKTGTNATISGEETAQYGKDYTFTVTEEAGYLLSNVTVKLGETDVEYTKDDAGNYIISGTNIKGDLTITATAVAAEGYTQITFTGVDSTEVVGGLTQTAENGKDFTFQLNKEAGYFYAVKLGNAVLSADAEGLYTITGDQIDGTPLTVVITKTAMGSLNVEVRQYLTLDETVMWLVKANLDQQVLAYGEGNTMYWSSKYSAYCWLVISAEGEDAVKEAAMNAIIPAAADAVAAQIAYDCDVNQSQGVDVNDAQLTYDMYQAKMYSDFERVTMDKFLEADVNFDGIVNVEDAAAIVTRLLK